MPVSALGRAFIGSKEACYLYGYKDSGGVWTAGMGHTAAAGGLKPGPSTKLTLAQACQLLTADLKKYSDRVIRALGPLKQHELDGFTSFDMNTGAITSGTVDDRWNRGDRAGALNVLGQYVNDNGKRLAGLVTRRAEEIKIIRDGKYPANMLILVKDNPASSGRLVQASSLPWDTPVPVVKIDPSFNIPTPAPAAVRPNFIIDLARYLWSFIK